MAINKLKNKISNLASGEILGETTEEEKRKEQERERRQREKKRKTQEMNEQKASKQKRPNKQPKERKPKERNVTRESFFKRKERNIIEEIEQPTKQPEIKEEQESKVVIKESIDGYEDVLSILNIKENIELDVDFESRDLDYIEFSQTTPLGFDFDEVTDFISRVKYTLNKYESALKQRNKELVIVASEVKKVEQKMVEQTQAKELEKMIGGMTEEERLIEENMDLKIEINNLKTKLINQGGDSEVVDKLQKEIKALRAENEMLMRSEVKSSTQEATKNELPEPPKNEFKLPTSVLERKENKKSKGNSLPTFNTPSEITMPTYDEEEDGFLDDLMTNNKGKKDSLDEMIQDIGGEYDEK